MIHPVLLQDWTLTLPASGASQSSMTLVMASGEGGSLDLMVGPFVSTAFGSLLWFGTTPQGHLGSRVLLGQAAHSPL